MSRRSLLRRLASWLLVAAALGFITAEIVTNLDHLRDVRWRIRPALLVLSLASMTVVFLGGIAVWRRVLRGFGVSAAFRPLARAWFLANLTRYIPGMIWQFVSMAQLGPRMGLSPALAVTSVLVQMGFLVIGATLVGVGLLPLELAGELEPLVLVLRYLSPLALVAVHPRVIRAMVAAAARVTRQPELRWLGGWTDGMLLLGMSLAIWIAYGAAFHLFLLSVVEMPDGALAVVLAANAIGFVAGYLAFFAPGGLGFKEGALAVVLTGLLPSGVAFALAVASRLWTIAAELIAAAVFLRSTPEEPAVGAEAGGAERG